MRLSVRERVTRAMTASGWLGMRPSYAADAVTYTVTIYASAGTNGSEKPHTNRCFHRWPGQASAPFVTANHSSAAQPRRRPGTAAIARFPLEFPGIRTLPL